MRIKSILRPKLLTKKGKPVPEWQRTRARQAALPELRRAARRAPAFEAPPLRIPKEQLVIWTLPAKFGLPDLLEPFPRFCRIVCRPPRLPMYRVRKDQKVFTATEWATFLHAIETIAVSGVPSPTYPEFVGMHDLAMTTPAGHMWGAHGGQNFLAWHREYLAKLEARLILINPLVTIPYWNWAVDRAVPASISNPGDLTAWGVTRSFSASWLPTPQQVNNALAAGVGPPDFATFQSAVEGIHNYVHGAVGGTMSTSRSPADPIFWLHHAFIDKLWDDWQRAHPAPAFNPPNVGDTLQPPPVMTRTVSQVLRTTDLGYVYQ